MKLLSSTLAAPAACAGDAPDDTCAARSVTWLDALCLAGWLLMLGSATALIATRVGATVWIPVAAVIATGLVSYIYSFLTYNALEGR